MSGKDERVLVTETYGSDGIPTTGKKAGTAEDREAMRRLGKDQLFKVGDEKIASLLKNTDWFSETLVFFPYLASV